MIQTLTVEEQSRLILALNDERKIATGAHRLKILRDFVLILLGLRCGFRVGECQKLRVLDVWDNGQPVARIHVPANFNKCNVEGWVAVNEELQAALKEFVPIRLSTVPSEANNPILLPSRPGLKAFSDRLSRPAVMDIIEYWRKKARIPHFHFHTLRHTFATNVLQRGGGNIKIVQLVLRHRHLSSSSIYLHPTQDEIDTAVLKSSNPAPTAQA